MADLVAGNDWRVEGRGLGYTDSTILVNDRDFCLEVDTCSASVYAGKAIDAGEDRKLNVIASLGVSYSG